MLRKVSVARPHKFAMDFTDLMDWAAFGI